MNEDPDRHEETLDASSDEPATLDSADLLDAFQLPEQVGPFRIVRKLGEGGMGAVFEAEQERPRRRVALKAIRQGFSHPQGRRRFEQELQVLGHLHHPGIAQIYEAGTVQTEQGEQPYFAMEYVDGKKLVDFANSQKLSARQRLMLMAKVADAVQHAHERGVVHRDLKPGNILVVDESETSGVSGATSPSSVRSDRVGQPKILDFGVARATDLDLEVTVETAIGQVVGTVPYMSPEQVLGGAQDIDGRSDVYALGVITYQLLAGHMPYDVWGKPMHEAAQVIRESEPRRLRAVDRKLRGDVETIVAKALEKDRERRYQSAEELAADIRRYLGEEPILARPASAVYRLRKFSRRNRALVSGLVAAFVMLLLGTVVSTWLAVRATRAERLAATRQKQSEKVSTFLQDMLASVDPSEAQGREVTVRESLDAAAREVDEGSLSDEPEVEAVVRRTVGKTYSSLGSYDTAEAQLRAALDLRLSLYGEGNPEVAESRLDLARVIAARGDYEQAEQLVELALPVLEEHYGDESVEVAAARSMGAGTAYNLGRFAEAEATQRQVVATLRQRSPLDEPRLAEAVNSLAFLLHNQHDDDAAEPLLREGLEILRRVHGSTHPSVLSALNQLAEILSSAGDVAAARATLEESLELARTLYGNEHPGVADVLWRLGLVATNQGDLDSAERWLAECVAMRRRLLGNDHRDVATALVSLGRVYRGRRQYDAAEVFFRQALEIRRRVFGDVHPTVAHSLQDLGDLFEAERQYERAEQLLRESIDVWRQSVDEDSPDLTMTIFRLAMAIQNSGDLERAEPFFRQVVDRQRHTYGDDHPLTASAVSSLGTLLYRQGKKEEAETIFREALEIERRHLDPENAKLLTSIGNLAFVLDARGAASEAERFHREYLEIARKNYAPAHPAISSSLCRYGLNQLQQEHFGEAETLFREAVELREEHLPEGHWQTAEAKSHLGEALSREGRYDEAERLLLAASEVLGQSAEASVSARKTVTERLVSLYESWGRPQVADFWRRMMTEK